GSEAPGRYDRGADARGAGPRRTRARGRRRAAAPRLDARDPDRGSRLGADYVADDDQRAAVRGDPDERRIDRLEPSEGPRDEILGEQDGGGVQDGRGAV